MWIVHNHIQGSSPTLPPLKTLKVVHFQGISYWKQPCVIRPCPHDFITALTLWSTFNSVCKVTEVSGQSVAHLTNSRMLLCGPLNTERYCSLLTAAWHLLAEMCSFIKVYIINDNENDLPCVWLGKAFGGCSPFFATKGSLSCSCCAEDVITSCHGLYHEACNSRWTEQGLIMIRYTS